MAKIKAGDLVMVVKPTICCGATGRIGMAFIAGDVRITEAYCYSCKRIAPLLTVAVPNKTGATGRQVAIEHYRLIRIDPPSTPQEIEREQETI